MHFDAVKCKQSAMAVVADGARQADNVQIVPSLFDLRLAVWR
jgi:hypothetical protein